MAKNAITSRTTCRFGTESAAQQAKSPQFSDQIDVELLGRVLRRAFELGPGVPLGSGHRVAEAGLGLEFTADAL